MNSESMYHGDTTLKTIFSQDFPKIVIIFLDVILVDLLNEV